MNCESCDVPKNSRSAATTGRTLISVCGVIASMSVGRHAVADDALHAAQTRTELVLDELADRTKTTVAEVVDVVGLDRDIADQLAALVQRDDVADSRHDVALGEDLLVEGLAESELLVDLCSGRPWPGRSASG